MPAIVTVTSDVAIRVEVEIYEHNYAKSVNDVVKSRRHHGKTFTTAPTLRLCNSFY